MRIQHNIMAMNAYRNYNNNTKALSGNLEKLSSGYKINRAGDDAAGLAISEKMRAQITGLDAAQKNVKDGISLVKTAEGAMQEIQDMLNRMDYLATQSANGTYDNDVDRLNLQKEVDALKSEINRIADSANFNGIKLLDGSLDTNNTVSTTTGTKNIALLTTADCQVGDLVHKEGVKATKASFEVNLKEAFSVANADASIAAGSTRTVTVTIGSTSVQVKVSFQSAVKKGAAIDLSKVSFAAATGAAGTSITLKAANGSDYKFSVSVNPAGKMTVTAKASQAALDFDAAKAVKIEASKVSFDLKSSTGNSTSYDCYTQNVKNGYAAKGTQLAHAHMEITDEMLKALADEDSPATLKIDGAEITFDRDVTTTSGNTVGIKDLLKKTGVDKDGNDIMELDLTAANKKELMARISRAAITGNDAFHVGVDGNTLTLQEKADYYDPDNSSKDDLLDSIDKIQAKIKLEVSTSTSTGQAGGALKLQIGDTADSFNQLEVKVGDMHVTAMKDEKTGKTIKDVDISKQDTAKDAIDTIKAAINYVSGVRGDLGAIQNRLDHTANNLSVMAENIQDAESTIRDTDVADEMMKYVKNNILVQSAQAMLAQANQVPQGVLQLLG